MKRSVLLLLCLAAALAASNTASAGSTWVITANTTLTADHQGPVVIGADGITLDCAGHTVSGSGSGIGIVLTGRTGVIVQNCDVTGFYLGIYLDGATNNVLLGNEAASN